MTRPAPAADDIRWMRYAIELAHRCPAASGAYSVGAVIVDEHGNEISSGFSRDTDNQVHAEESALAKPPAGHPPPPAPTLFRPLGPFFPRKPPPLSCTQLIIDAKLPRVV